MASATTDLRLPSQSQNIAAVRLVPSYTAWWQRHVCEQLAWGRCLTAARPGVELATSRVASQRLNHYTTRPHFLWAKSNRSRLAERLQSESKEESKYVCSASMRRHYPITHLSSDVMVDWQLCGWKEWVLLLFPDMDVQFSTRSWHGLLCALLSVHLLRSTGAFHAINVKQKSPYRMDHTYITGKHQNTMS